MEGELNLAGTAGALARSDAARFGANRAVTLLRMLGLVIALSVVIAGTTGYPIPFNDAFSFMPASIQLANGHGLTDPVYAPARLYDPQARLIYHGFSYELLLGVLIEFVMPMLRSASIASVAALGIIHAFSLLAVNEMSIQVIRLSRTQGLAIVVAAAGLTSFVAAMLLFGGRPEELAAIPVALLVVIIVRRGATPVTALAGGVCVGIAATISPIPSAMAGLLLAAYFAAVEETRAALIQAVLAGAAAIGTALALTLILYPYPIGDLLWGIQRHAAAVTTEPHVARFLPNFVTNADVPMYGLVILLGLLALALAAVQTVRRRHAGWLLALCLAGFALVFGYSVVLNTNQIYNVFPLWPAIIAYAVWCAGAGRSQGFGRRSGYVFLLAFALPSVGLIRTVLLFPFFLTEGLSPVQAQRAFTQQLAQIDAPKILVSNSVFLLTDDYTRIVGYAEDTPADAPLVVMEYRSGASVPPAFAGYRVVFSTFTPEPAKVFGVTVAHSIPGYQFAIYRWVGS